MDEFWFVHMCRMRKDADIVKAYGPQWGIFPLQKLRVHYPDRFVKPNARASNREGEDNKQDRKIEKDKEGRAVQKLLPPPLSGKPPALQVLPSSSTGGAGFSRWIGEDEAGGKRSEVYF